MNGWRLINSLVPPLHTQPPPHHCWQLGRVKKTPHMWILEGEGSRYQGLEWGGGRNNKRDLVLREELQFVLFTVEKKKKKKSTCGRGLGSQGVWCREKTGGGAGRTRSGRRVPGWLRARRAGGGEGAPRTLLPIWCVLQAPF